jgi:hypothetical protein
MEYAWFRGRVLNIVDEYVRLSNGGVEKKEVIHQLGELYRISSRKGSFTCICCGETVELVLPLDRSVHFRHKGDSECAASEHYQKYKRQKEKYENQQKHLMGKTIIRSILEGQLKPFDVTVQDGYQYREPLTFIPDLIIRFPEPQQVWALDYFTGFRGSKGYAAHIQKRKEAYLQQGIRPFFLVDEEWLAYQPQVSKMTTLLESELQMMDKRPQDRDWNLFLLDMEPELLDLYLDKPHRYEPFDTRSMVYVHPQERRARILRFLYTSHRDAFVLTEPITISLEQALTLSPDREGFQWYGHQEDEKRALLKEHLWARYYQWLAEEEQKQKEQAMRQKQPNAGKRETPASENPLNTPAGTWSSSNQRIKGIRTQEEMDEDLARRNAALHSPYMKKRKKQLIEATQHHILRQSARESQAEQEDTSPEEKVARKKREEKKERILSRKIAGETYIDGNPRQWKEFVLYRFNAVARQELDLPKLMEELKQNGFTFNQHDALVKYPIKEFLQLVGKEVGREIKL